jgi:predicted RecB family nuclease
LLNTQNGGKLRLAADGNWNIDTRDLMRVSSCNHCTTLSVMRTLAVPAVMSVLKPYIDAQEQARRDGTAISLPQRYGITFETALEAELKATTPEGTVQKPELGSVQGDPLVVQYQKTLELMELGVPVIYQGALIHSTGITQFRGMPDFLVRSDWRLEFIDDRLTAYPVQEPHLDALTLPPGKPLYTAWDAKLSTKPKPNYALQVGLYISALEAAGFKAPDATHGLVLGSRRIEPLTESEVAPATALARAVLEAKVTELANLSEDQQAALASELRYSCDTKKACDVCEYPDLCDHTRFENNDIILVHGIREKQRVALVDAGIKTVEQLATASEEQRPAGIDEKAWGKLQRQAAAQQTARATGKPFHMLLPKPALAALPPASPGDIFFDMEGFPYYRGGLEYLFGNYTRQEEFVEFWAHTRADERAAFEAFMRWATDRLAQYPDAHIYHYASYEQSALRRLANRHATMELEVDALTSNQKFVDLAEVVKNSLIVGEQSYSIKYLEPHYGFKRSAEVKKATDSVEGYGSWLQLTNIANNEELGSAERIKAKQDADAVIADLREYNKEDVISTLALYEWLASMDGAGSLWKQDAAADEEEHEDETKAQRELAQLIEETKNLMAPLNGLSYGEDPVLDARADAWAALAHSILFYKREKAMYWTGVHVRMSSDSSELANDKAAASLLKVEETYREGAVGAGKTARVKRGFVAEIDVEDIYRPKKGQGLIVRFTGTDSKPTWCFGEVTEIAGTSVWFTAQFPVDSEDALPDAIFELEHFPVDGKVAAIKDLANQITSVWGHPHNEPPVGFPGLELLLRNVPRLGGLAGLPDADQENFLPAIITAVENLDNSVLAIQGPPGTGKTYLASHTIAHLVSLGKRVGVVATAHKASENLLQACIEAGVPGEVIFKQNKSGDTQKRDWKTPSSTKTIVNQTRSLNCGFVVGGTSWTFSSDAILDLRLDYLFIDEAAQFSMVDAIANSRAAKNLVLLGDPQQLAQVVTAIHPGGVENSALGHYMGDNAILPAEQGYFVSVTRRLHPKVNSAVSWLAYEGKLHNHATTESFAVPGKPSGIHSVPVAHHNNSTHSPEEVDVVVQMVREHLQTIPAEEILVITPYNAQVAAISRALEAAGFDRVEVGTVDKFQGREASVVIYSFAASDSDSAPRGVEFLLDQHRLNVGISRAKAVCYLVHSPRLIASNFRTLPELKAISRLAGLLEFARTA